MKKITKLLAFSLVILGLSGCNSTLVSKNATADINCRYVNSEDESFTITQDLKFSFKDGTFVNSELVNELVYADAYVGQYEPSDLVNILKDAFSDYKSVETEPTDKGAIVTINMDIDEFATLADIDKEDLANIKEDDIPDIEKGLEEAGYTCK